MLVCSDFVPEEHRVVCQCILIVNYTGIYKVLCLIYVVVYAHLSIAGINTSHLTQKICMFICSKVKELTL